MVKMKSLFGYSLMCSVVSLSYTGLVNRYYFHTTVYYVELELVIIITVEIVEWESEYGLVERILLPY